MKALKSLAVLSLLPIFSMAQMKIMVTHDRSKAEVLVYKTQYFSEADMVIKKTWDPFEATKKHHWYFVSNNQAAEADWIVYYTDNMDSANHVVYFTDNPKLLGTYAACRPLNLYPLKKKKRK